MSNPQHGTTMPEADADGQTTVVDDDEVDFELPLRTESEIGEAADEFFERVWYDRNQVLLEK